LLYKDSIRVTNLLIRDFHLHHHFDEYGDPVAKLVSKQASSKFEEPDGVRATERRESAWKRWIDVDGDIPNWVILGPNWAKARLLCHSYLANYHVGDLTFTNGSSFEPLRNATSVAAKLSAKWTITEDCFDAFCRLTYRHRAIKSSAKKRFESYIRKRGWSLRSVNRKLWQRYGQKPNAPYEIFKFKTFCVVTFVDGNRYSTVPKNNEKDRSICLEPLCNMLVQRAVGVGIRRCLKDNAGINLDTLADVHRLRISDPKVATIDLSDCSDTIGLKLVRYLLPPRVYRDIESCRSDMTLGPDGDWYYPNKVSSMGNGFTFDLMSLILTALSRAFDPQASSFGDDIVCSNEVADEVVGCLVKAGFKPNLGKTLIRSAYRESCGCHFIDGHGYVTQFDFRWANTVHDVIVLLNKVALLDRQYGGHWGELRHQLWKHLPPIFFGVAKLGIKANTGRPPSYNLDTYVRYGPRIKSQPKPHVLKAIRRHVRSLQLKGEISIALMVENRNVARASRSLRSTEWHMFYQYIHSARITPYSSKLELKSNYIATVGEDLVDLPTRVSRKGE